MLGTKINSFAYLFFEYTEQIQNLPDNQLNHPVARTQ